MQSLHCSPALGAHAKPVLQHLAAAMWLFICGPWLQLVGSSVNHLFAPLLEALITPTVEGRALLPQAVRVGTLPILTYTYLYYTYLYLPILTYTILTLYLPYTYLYLPILTYTYLYLPIRVTQVKYSPPCWKRWSPPRWRGARCCPKRCAGELPW
jgi:hypothetical protein